MCSGTLTTMVALQGSLFDTGTRPALGPLGAVRRIELADGAWLDHLPGWVGRADLLFEALVGAVPWRSEERVMYDRTVEVPRLVAHYGAGVPLPHAVLGEAMAALGRHYRATPGGDFASVGLCLYPRRTRQRRLARGHRRSSRRRAGTRRHRLPGLPPDARPAVDAAPGPVTALRRGRGRPAGDGGQLPTDLGARRPEDVPSGGSAHQCAVPPGGGRLSSAGHGTDGAGRGARPHATAPTVAGVSVVPRPARRDGHHGWTARPTA